MSRIASVFKASRPPALIPYLTIGYPSVAATLEIAPLLAASGCDIIELGIPFSDPLADGTTIQKASQQALKNGVTPQVCLEVANQLRQKVEVPLVFMTYYNPVLNIGLRHFCSSCAEVGIDGLIVPDLPPEEGAELETATQEYNLDLIYLLAPTSTEERIDLVAKKSRGFIYLVSLTGVTGAREALPMELESFVASVRRRVQQPLCVGFGVSSPEQARRVARVANGVIVGSRIIQLIEGENPLPRVQSFIESLRNAISDLSQSTNQTGEQEQD